MSQKHSSEISETKIIILVTIVSLTIMFGGIIFLSKTSNTPNVSPSSNAKVIIANDSYNWGNIPINGGYAIKTFTIKNTGNDTLKLLNVKTSCHCTTATVIINGIESQAFGMSGVSSWVGEVLPGKEASLKVSFDPAFHGPQGTGPIERYVSVETNDKSKRKLTFTLSGVVVK